MMYYSGGRPHPRDGTGGVGGGGGGGEKRAGCNFNTMFRGGEGFTGQKKKFPWGGDETKKNTAFGGGRGTPGPPSIPEGWENFGGSRGGGTGDFFHHFNRTIGGGGAPRAGGAAFFRVRFPDIFFRQIPEKRKGTQRKKARRGKKKIPRLGKSPCFLCGNGFAFFPGRAKQVPTFQRGY